MASRRLLLVTLLWGVGVAFAVPGNGGARAAQEGDGKDEKPLAARRPVSERAARAFLAEASALLAPVFTVAAEAAWTAATDVSPAHAGARAGAEKAAVALVGSPFFIESARAFLRRPKRLTPITRRQLEKLLLLAAENPGTLPQVVGRRIEAEARQASLQDGFTFCLQVDARDHCLAPLSTNDIDEGLRTVTDLDLRRKLWEASKDVGAALKPGLGELVALRNQIAKEMGYPSFFALKVADYGMNSAEMMALLDETLTAIAPLYAGLSCWARHSLAARFKQPVPPKLPAHWLGNRWAQTWPGLAPGIDLERAFAQQNPQSLVRAAGAFYVSLGFSPLPDTFWAKSDLYPVPAGAARKKDAYASSWHIDRAQDVRSLMSVVPGQRWFGTAHHELGHIYYYLAYARPEVPYLLRTGANRAFHEAIGELARLASMQEPYLRQAGIIGQERKLAPLDWLLDAAMDAIVFLPFAAGTMSHFERDLYDESLPPAAWQERWWSYVDRYQGVVPPAQRPAGHCDACTKTQLNDDPAQYYDYALATLIKFQLHDHICTKILGQDVRACLYAGSKAVGDFLRGILAVGATRDWRAVMKEATGEPIGPRALLAFFAPLGPELDRLNRKLGRGCPSATAPAER